MAVPKWLISTWRERLDLAEDGRCARRARSPSPPGRRSRRAMTEQTLSSERDQQHQPAGAHDVVGVALGDAVVDDVGVEVGQVQVGDGLHEKQEHDHRDLFPVGTQARAQERDHRSTPVSAGPASSAWNTSAQARPVLRRSPCRRPSRHGPSGAPTAARSAASRPGGPWPWRTGPGDGHRPSAPVSGRAPWAGRGRRGDPPPRAAAPPGRASPCGRRCPSHWRPRHRARRRGRPSAGLPWPRARSAGSGGRCSASPCASA